MGAFDKVVFRGKLMDEKCKAFLMAMEERLGYELTVVQGNYNPGGVAQSGGTHDGGGVVDLTANDWQKKVRIAADLGAFVWYRQYVPGLWGAHVHLGIRNHGKLSSTAVRQQQDWDSKPPRNGLASHAVMNLKTDYHPGREIEFEFPVKVKPATPKKNKATQAYDKVIESIHYLGDAAALLDDVDPSRVQAKHALDRIKTERTRLKGIAADMPRK